MININFYTFSKKENSTKRPTGAGTVLSCNIKSRSSIVNPFIELKTNPTAFNYCYIPSFNRYYYISDITFDSGLWLVTCRIDVLATYKTEIGNTSMYILRSWKKLPLNKYARVVQKLDKLNSQSIKLKAYVDKMTRKEV